MLVINKSLNGTLDFHPKLNMDATHTYIMSSHCPGLNKVFSLYREDSGGVVCGQELGGAALQPQLSFSSRPSPPRPLVQE